MTLRVIILSTLIVLVFVKQYPLYKQCDQRWAWEQMGTSFYSICDAGSLLSSLAMASPKDYNPLTLNQWLKVNGKYKGNTIYLTALDQIGLKYLNKISNSNIKRYLDEGNVVIGETVWGYVLIERYEGDTLFVNNPTRDGGDTYPLKDLIDGETVVFKII